MNYSEGESFELPDATWLKISVNVDDADFHQLVNEWSPEVALDASKAPLGLEYDCLTYLAQRFILMRRARALAEGPQPPNEQRKTDLLTRLQRNKALGDKLRERVRDEVPVR